MTTSSSAFESTFATAKFRVDGAVSHHLEQSLGSFGVAGTLEHPVFAATVRASLAGGKRFRAISALVGAAAAISLSEENLDAPALLDLATNDGSLSLSATLEFYQAAALVHDDIVDRAEDRRGRPSFHRELEESHRSESGIGEATHYGVASAVLAGDLLIAAAAHTLEDTHAAVNGEAMRKRFAKMTGEVAYGQYLELYATHAPLSAASTDSARTEQIVALKSARYSVAHPVALGALQAGGSLEFAENLERIFEPAGMAFQLRDDDLGVFGDEDATGKSASGDLVERKRTTLLGLTYERADRSDRSTLEQVFSAPGEPDEQSVAHVRDIFARHGREPHEEQITRYREQADTRLREARLPAAATELCSTFIDKLVDRKW